MFDVDAKIIQRMAPQLQRVLVVDSQPAGVKLLQELMRSIVTCQVWAANSDAKAIQAARAVDPQIIFMELQGQDLDGVRLAKALRRSDLNCRKVPIIIITAEATAQSIIAARDAGVHEFLRKPFTIKDLVRRLEAVTLKARDWVEAVDYIGPDRRRFNSGDYKGPRKRRSDTRTTDAARMLQALKIVRAAHKAIDSDWHQARRALLAQATDLQAAAKGLGNPELGAAAHRLEQVSVGLAPDRAGLAAVVGTLMTFFPKEDAAAAA